MPRKPTPAYTSTPIIVLTDQTTAGGAKASSQGNTDFTVTRARAGRREPDSKGPALSAPDSDDAQTFQLKEALRTGCDVCGCIVRLLDFCAEQFVVEFW